MADIVSVLTACVVLVNLVTGLHGWRSFRRARRELRPRLVSLMVGLVATALAAVVAILTPGLSSAPQSAQAQSTDIVLLPRGAEWSYFFNNYSVPPIPKGPAPFTINACAGDGGTPWWSGGAYIDMYGAEFSAAGVPHNAKVKIRSTGALPISSFPNQVSVSINGYTVGYDQPNGECDAYWNTELTFPDGVIKPGTNTVGVHAGRYLGNFDKHAIDIEIVAGSVDPPPADASFGSDLIGKIFTSDPIETSTGNFSYQRADIAIPGRGGGVSFSRSYNSLDTRTSTLGPGWTHTYNTHLDTSAETGWPTGTVRIVQWDGRTDRYTPSGSGYAGPGGRQDELTYYGPPLMDGTAWLLMHPDFSALHFDASGHLISATDRNGNTITLTYDSGTGRLLTVADPAGRGSLSFGYDGSGRITSISDWASTPRQVRYTYDADGRLWKVWDREHPGTSDPFTEFRYQTGTTRLTQIVDANGHTAVEMSYDSSGRIIWQRDALGNQTDIDYQADKTIQTLPSASFGSSFRPTIEHDYDGQRRVVKVITTPASGESITEESTYDGRWNRVAVKDGRGNTTSICYDDYGQVIRAVAPAPATGVARPITVYEYGSPSGGHQRELVKTTAPLGVTLTNSGDDPANCGSALTVNAQGLYQTSYEYDAHHNPTKTTRRYTDPDTSSVQTAVGTVEYDTTYPDLVSYVTQPRGNTGSSPDHTYATHLSYFTSGGKQGLLQSTADPLGNTVSYDYDNLGRRTSMVDANGNASGATPADHRWLYEHDNEDRVRFTRAPAPTVGGSRLVTESRYDAVGNLATLIDANGQVIRYLYDARDSLQEVWESPSAWTDPATTPSPKYVTAYQYDHLGNLSRVTRAQGDGSYERVVDYTYDGLNRVRSETQYPSWPSTSPTLVMQTTYDANSNRTSVVDQLGQTTSYSYDRLNRLTGVDYSDAGTPDVSYTYDANSRRLTMQDGTGKTASCYDELSRLLSVTSGLSSGASISCPNVSGGSRVGYRYDRDGNRTKLIYPNGDAVTYAFDKAARLTSLTDWASRVTGYDYDPDGALKIQTNVNGTVAVYSYDNARRLTDLWNKPSAVSTDAITRHQFTLDAAGNRTQVVETLAQVLQPGPGTAPTGLPAGHPETPTTVPSGLPTGHALTPTTAPSALPSRPGPSTAPFTQTLLYGYDRLYRLTSASGGQAGSTTYGYDPVGNRLSRTRGTTTSYSYDRTDRIMAAGAVTYSVDQNGNVTDRGADAFTFDQPNRLKTATVSGTSASYTYDGDGKRISTTVGTTTTSYLYDTNRSLPVLLEDGARRYVWGLGLAYEIEAGAALVYHSDGLHSVRALTNASKTVVQTDETDEFGVPVSGGSSGQPFGYTGERRDLETGLLDLRAREYDPNAGRFLQRDTLLGKKDHPSTTNRFSYVENNPANRRDPSGMKSRSLSSCGLQSFGGDWGSCSVTINCTGPVCTLGLDCSRVRPVRRPKKEECTADCELACAEAEWDCMIDWLDTENPGVDPTYSWDPSECQHGGHQCEETGGCFLNPGWRQRMPGKKPRPIWEKVWGGRRQNCDT